MTLHRIALIPGDGIGPEVLDAAVSVVRAVAASADLSLSFERFDLGAERYLRTGETLPESAFEALRDDFDAIFLGALGDPRVPSNVHAKEILLGLRFRLDLFINYRPVRLLDSARSPLKGKGTDEINFVVFRENTEGLYTGVGGQFKRGTPDEVAIEAEMNTRKGVDRILRAAFNHAVTHGLTELCMADKSNAMRHGHDLWQRAFWEMASEYPTVNARHLYVDVLAMEMIRAPETFQVIVTNNLFGDILTDLGAQLQGGIGLAASANLHPGKHGLFEPVHGSAPALAGKGTANPLAAVLSGGMMLSWLGYPELQQRVEQAVTTTLLDGVLTPELGGTASTQDVTDHLLHLLSPPEATT